MQRQRCSVFFAAFTMLLLILVDETESQESFAGHKFRNCSFLSDHEMPQSCLDKYRFRSSRLKTLPENMCRFSIDEETRSNIFSGIKDGNNVMTFLLHFPNHTESNCIQTKDVFNYTVWVWSYFGGTGLLPILTGPFDYDIMSLGLLTLRRSVVDINIKVNDPSCHLVFGVNRTNAEITSLLYDAITNNGTIQKDDNPAFYDIKWQSRFCYLTYNYTLSNQNEIYYISHFTGLVLSNDQFTSFNCCHPQRPGDCQFVIKVTYWMQIIQWLSYLIVMLSPLLILSLASTDDFRSPCGDEMNYTLFDDDMRDLSEDDWISANPFTIKRALHSCCSFGGNNVCWTRMKRAIICLIIIPSQVFIRFIIYSKYKYYSLESRLKADIPLGFFSMMFGFKRSLYNWKCFMGGPFVLYSICFTLGVFLICLPENLPDMLTDGAFEERKDHQISSPLMIDLRLLERFSSIPCSSYRGQALLYRIFSARLHVLLNCKFWKYCVNLCYRRFLKHVSYMNTEGKSVILCVLYHCAIPVLAILTVVVIVIEFILLFLFHFFSMFYLGWLSYIQYLRYLRKFTRNSKHRMWNTLFRCWLSQMLFSSLFLLLFIIISYGYVRLVLSLFNYIMLILDYTLLGIIINARDVINYFIVGIVVLVYIWKSMAAFLTEYENLLKTVIVMSHSLQTQITRTQNRIYVDKQTLCIESEQSFGPFDKIRVNGLLARLKGIHEAMEITDRSTSHRDLDILRTVGGISAIRKDLFMYVVEKHCPVRNRLFSSLVKIIFTCFFTIMVVNSILTFHRQSNFDDILRIAAILLTGGIPVLFNVFSSSTDQSIKHIRYQQDVMKTVMTYWQRSRDRLRDDA